MQLTRVCFVLCCHYYIVPVTVRHMQTARTSHVHVSGQAIFQLLTLQIIQIVTRGQHFLWWCFSRNFIHRGNREQRKVWFCKQKRKQNREEEKCAHKIANAQRVLRCPLLTISFHSIGLTTTPIR